MAVSVELRWALFFSSVLFGTVTVFARADAATHVGPGRAGTSFNFHLGRQAARESDPAKLLTVPFRKPNAQASPRSELRPFFENPLRLRHMAVASPIPIETANAI